MDEALANDPVLERLRDELPRAFGGRVNRALLYGSRARGDARPESDYDVAVFLQEYQRSWDELGKVGAIADSFLADLGVEVNILTFPDGALNERTLLMHEIRKDGRDLL